MSYYRGDYYRGDYYKGDPFLGGLIAGVGGRLVGKAARWVGRQTVGGLIGKTAGAAAAGATAVSVARSIPVGRGSMPISLGPIGIDPGAALPGGDPLFTWGRAKRRKMNPLNPKALRRALRRAEGFEKFAARTVNSLYKVIDGRKVRTYKRKAK